MTQFAVVPLTFSTVIAEYESAVDDLSGIHKKKGGGKSRSSSGIIFENVVTKTCQILGMEAKKNDYKRSEFIDGLHLAKKQVDAHIYVNGILKKMVECKTYLDSCYLDRAMSDLKKLVNSPDVPDDVEFAIFAGQNGCDDNTLAYCKAEFKRDTGKILNTFFINPQYKRDSKRPIYNPDYRSHFYLDVVEYNKFVEWVQK